ncbi:hypothetical protein OIV83_004668 [Microbotryomycetes sp. JL201]|nr:hypothetical protein OIV83_004668 [Microbotryomycetes sp. JL201]
MAATVAAMSGSSSTNSSSSPLVRSNWSSNNPTPSSSTQPSPIISDSGTASTSTTPKAHQPSQLQPALHIVERIAGPPATVGLSSTLHSDRPEYIGSANSIQQVEPFDYLAAIDQLDELEDEREAAEDQDARRGDLSAAGSLSESNPARLSSEGVRASPSTRYSAVPLTPPRSIKSSAPASTNASPMSAKLFDSPSASLRRKLKQSSPFKKQANSTVTAADVGGDAAAADGPDCTCNGGGGDLEYTRSPRAASILSGTKDAKPAPEMSGDVTVEKLPFERFSLPTKAQIEAASKCLLVGESGQSVEFGELVRERGSVIVVFLRHLWCGLCQQYVKALRQANHNLHAASTASLSTGSSRAPAVPLYILLISSGSPALIPIYRSRLDCPFPLYVDRKRTLYKALGMTLKTLNPGKEKDKGSYVEISMGQNIVASLKSTVAMRGYPGKQAQLGGEFVFTVNESESDEITCSFASRMSTTRNHAEASLVRELFAAAGVRLSDEDASSVFGTTE